MAQVTLDRVSKVYPGDVLAVDQVHLSVQDGQFIVLVGPSGCGKSTTLRMVAGLEEISAGTISIGDRVVNDVAPKDRDIAMVFQNYALYPHMSVYKNMAFGLKLRKIDKNEIDRRIQEASRILGIEHLLQRKPKALSGGQRQRVAVGRAIVRKPAAFLFDEPLSNLDAKLRVQTRAELKALHQRLATTTLYVTHDQEEAMTLGDRVVVMANTKVQQDADPLTVYDRPVNRFVAAFVGTPPMNFVPGQLEKTGSGIAFRGAGFVLPMPEDKAALLAGKTGQDVVLGLRPEGLYLKPNADAPEQYQIPVKITVTETLGGQMDLFCELDKPVDPTDHEKRFVARVKSEAPGSLIGPAQLYVEPSKLHVFEPGEFGANLTLI